MRNLALAILGIFSSGLAMDKAQAAPLHLSMEVAEVDLRFSDLFALNGATPTIGTAEYQEIAEHIHPVGMSSVSGSSVIIKLDALSDDAIAQLPSDEYTHALTCVSGVLCELDNGNLFPGFGEYTPVFDAGNLSGFRYGSGFATAPVGTNWDLDLTTGQGNLFTEHDGAISGTASHAGTDYFWWSPTATFTFSNVSLFTPAVSPQSLVSVTPTLITAPLPAPGILLGGAMAALLVMRRRKAMQRPAA